MRFIGRISYGPEVVSTFFGIVEIEIPLKGRAPLPKEGASWDTSREHGDCMPVFKIGGKLCYFAHIPKCGGSSVAAYLKERVGPVGCFAPLKWHDGAERWSRPSPQHIDWASLQHLLPEAMLDAVFAVVRHPVARIVSAYHFGPVAEKWTCRGKVPVTYLIQAALRSNLSGLFPLRAECRLRGL